MPAGVGTSPVGRRTLEHVCCFIVRWKAAVGRQQQERATSSSKPAFILSVSLSSSCGRCACGVGRGVRCLGWGGERAAQRVNVSGVAKRVWQRPNASLPSSIHPFMYYTTSVHSSPSFLLLLHLCTGLPASLPHANLPASKASRSFSHPSLLSSPTRPSPSRPPPPPTKRTATHPLPARPILLPTASMFKRYVRGKAHVFPGVLLPTATIMHPHVNH